MDFSSAGAGGASQALLTVIVEGFESFVGTLCNRDSALLSFSATFITDLDPDAETLMTLLTIRTMTWNLPLSSKSGRTFRSASTVRAQGASCAGSGRENLMNRKKMQRSARGGFSVVSPRPTE